ncbi:hypothetical protein BX659_102164 [Orenia metallireducens]|jgi:hypothetical protein|uniref:Uncharacterized protein n=1 Tax=Orenia metallireducens TaxID=1413210 RepID=A0A285F6N8_9FIRM|nr:hypothetical protein [Orenia metallireducens]PRX34848.1 hypothetical protein BX659_102164 [Orenia metallireducens]SNY05861.1 hypothetical protein SAMN06265827_101162 [Orenia metallireducens]
MTTTDIQNISNDYEKLMDHQFNLLQDMINLSDYVIYQEYQDLQLLKTGRKLLNKMIEINKLNIELIDNFPEEEEVKFIIKQYQNYQLDPIYKIEEEIKNLEVILEDIEEVSENYNNVDEDFLIDTMDTIVMIATYNLRDYENTLKDTFGIM